MRIPSLRFLSALALAGALFSCSEAPTAPEVAQRATTFEARLVAPSLVISQVYGGGGNAGATYKNDFIEIFNPTSSPISVAGWSVQYASNSGTSWQVTPLSGTVQPGQYYLVQEAAGTGGTVNLPTPDASGAIPMSGSQGKVVLASQTTALSGACPVGATVIDRFGFGANNCGLATAWTQTALPNLTNTTSASRLDGGCAYAADAGTVFANGAVNPRNTATALHPCEGDPEPVVAASVVISPNGGTIPVGGTLNLDAAAFDASSAAIPGEAIAWTSLDAGIATVDSTGLVSGAAAGVARIVATASSAPVADTALVTVEVIEEPPTGPVNIVEFHYDDAGADIDEKIEVAGPAGMSLSGWSIVLYNQTGGAQYATIALSGVFADLCSGRGVLVFDALGLQNGPADGIALVAPGNSVVEFLSYEGTLTATNGPANGQTSVDIGADEEPAPAEGKSLQKAPNGTWYGPNTSSFGACNGDAPPPPASTILITGRHPVDDVALPVGYEDQLFGQLLNGDGQSVPLTTFTWVSETPAIASIDARGVMRGLAPGSAIIRATASDSAGTTSTITFPITIATASGVPYNGNAEFGEPTDGDASDDYIVRHPQFTSSFNPVRNIPNWVAYEIDGAHIGSQDRCDCFTYDDSLPASFTRYTTADYTGAGAFHGFGIDRGHLARSFDRTSGSLDNARTFLFSNIIPQANSFNTGIWAQLENRLGDYARFENKEVYVIAGASGSQGTLKGEGVITLPMWTWKVAVIVEKDMRLADITARSQMQVIAVIMPNFGAPTGAWQTYQVTVDSVEALSGYDLLALLRDDFEIALESNTVPPVAALNGPYTGSEGGAASAMSAAASSDADNDALTYAWSFGDGAEAAGVATSHSYAQDGVYNVRLIVTDIRGLSDTTFTTATISNVAPSVSALPSATLLVGETYSASGTFTDPGADGWSASVDFGDGLVTSVPLSGNSWSIAHAYTSGGSFTVSLGVNDGSTTTSVSALVTVWTGAEGISAAQSMVNAMVANGTLSNGEGNSLGAKLRAAAAALERGQAATAINQLQAALNQLNALVQSGRLTNAQAAALRDLITRVIAALD